MRSRDRSSNPVAVVNTIASLRDLRQLCARLDHGMRGGDVIDVCVCCVCARALWSGRSGDDTDDASGAVHVMGEKEKISAVSTRYGVPVADLMRWNGVLDRLAFYPGQVVRLTAPKALATAEEKAEVKR